MLYEPDKILNIDLTKEKIPADVSIGQVAGKLVKGAGEWLDNIHESYKNEGPFPVLLKMTGKGKHAVSLASGGLVLMSKAGESCPDMRRNLHMDLLLSNPEPGLGDYSQYASADYSKVKGSALTALYTLRSQKPAASTPQALYGADRIIITAEDDPLLADMDAADKLRELPPGLYIEDAEGNLQLRRNSAEAEKALKSLLKRFQGDPLFLLQSDRIEVIESVVKNWVKHNEAKALSERTDAAQQQFEKQFAKAISDLQPSLITDIDGNRYTRHEMPGKASPAEYIFLSAGIPQHATEVTILPAQSQAAYSAIYPLKSNMSPDTFKSELIRLVYALAKTGESRSSKEYKALRDACENAALAAQMEEMERQNIYLLMDACRTLYEEAETFAKFTEECLGFLGDDPRAVFRLGIAKSLLSLTDEKHLDLMERLMIQSVSGSTVAKAPPVFFGR